jgi:hypothetical protein
MPNDVKPKMKKLRLSANEQIVKSYHCTEMKMPDCDGYLTVTNLRVIFHGNAESSRITQEVKLDNIAGISTFYGKQINYKVIFFVIGLVLWSVERLFSGKGSIGLVGWFMDLSSNSWIIRYRIDAIAAMILAWALHYFFWRRTFVLKIFSSHATSAPITLGAGYGNAGGNEAIEALIGYPTSETDLMMDELGVMIQDLQTLHDEAIPLWVGEEEARKAARKAAKKMARERHLDNLSESENEPTFDYQDE